MRDLPYKADEIPNFNERKMKANTLDEIISSDAARDATQMAALQAEQQFYPIESAESKVCRVFCISIIYVIVYEGSV